MIPRLILLGTGGALQTATRDNTALALVVEDRAVLVDCPGSACRKLLQGGVDPLRLAAVVITHLHTDHVYGLPSLVHNLWLLTRGRQLTSIPIYAPKQGMEPLRRLLAALDLDRRATFLDYRSLPGDPGTVFWEYHGHRLASHPVDHGPETFAIRWETPAGLRVVYSSDTRLSKRLPSSAGAPSTWCTTLRMRKTKPTGRERRDTLPRPRPAGSPPSRAPVVWCWCTWESRQPLPGG